MSKNLFSSSGVVLVDASVLPTHLAKVAARLNATGLEASGDTFLISSYLVESAIKTIAIALQVALRDRAPSHAYRVAYDLIRADGLGSWDAAIRECTSEPLVGFVAHECSDLVAWITRRRSRPEDEWFKDAKTSASNVLRALGVAEEASSRPQTVRDLISLLVQIRNKTKAHGAVGPDFFAQVNEDYVDATRGLIESCPLFAWQWMHLTTREKGSIRAIVLRGEGPQHLREAEAAKFKPDHAGVHFLPSGKLRFFHAGDLLRSNREYTRFSLPNGGYDGKGRAEFIDYGSGFTGKDDVGRFIAPPAQLPTSETQGQDKLGVQGHVWANLPPLPRGYIDRPRLDKELHERLRDKNHAIVTLHGRGGVGKTMLALNTAYAIASDGNARFDAILWFSARDVDLRASGPAFVKPAVVDLADVTAMYSRLMDTKKDINVLAHALEEPTVGSKGTLFIFDNFETMASIADLHQFLDAHTNLPNKTLITSRERAFKADYPIEVKGMEFDEGRRMLLAVARDLNIEGLATDDVIKGIFDSTEGHAYLMRVVMGEVAKEGRYVPPRQLVSKRLDIVDAVFERSFDKLSDAGRYVFMVIANWRSAVPAIALIAVLGELDLDAESGIDECLRLSLINRDFLRDGQPCYTAPLLARLFGQKKLVGDPDRLLIQNQIETIRRFGVLDTSAVGRTNQSQVTDNFIAWACDPNRGEPRAPTERIDRILQSLAEMWPPGWLALARFRSSREMGRMAIEYALRRAVEEMPENKDAWLARARFAEDVGDDNTRISASISAVDADPADVELLVDVAGQVARYVSENSAQIHPTRRGVYLASVRDHMERVVDSLSADGLSRLSWLHLLEGDTKNARRYAEQGLAKESNNTHCNRILEKLRSG